MKLKTTCQGCRSEFNLKKTYVDRPNLISHIGEYFILRCSHCAHEAEYHANDIVAYDNLKANIVGSAIGVAIIIGTTLFLWDMGMISNVGFIIGGGIIAASNMSTITSSASLFNQYRVTRRPKE